MTTALVTGATGFLGVHLVDELLARGVEVVALCRDDAPTRARKAELEGKGVRIAWGDVLERDTVLAAARGVDVLFHGAGRVSRDPKDAAALHRIHVDGTRVALDAAREAGVRKVVVASTSGVVCVTADPDEVRDETAPAPMDLIGRWPYYRSKLFAEQVAFEQNRDGMEVTCVNPALLLGPGDVAGSSTNDVVDFLERRLPAVPPGGISFVDARDAAIGLVLAWERGRGGERYLLAAQNLTMQAFCDKLERISGVKAPALTLPAKAAPLARAGAQLLGDLMGKARERLPNLPPMDPVSAEMAAYYWYVDSSKARRELGWEPRDPMDTLADTIADLRERGVVWPRGS
jgi:dihydroflavonol-4-reductase